MTDTRIIDEGEKKAQGVLHDCLHDAGFKASAVYYPDVWTRDTVVASIGALTTDVPEFHDGVRNSLVSMGRRQNKRGHVPNWVPVSTDATGMLNGAIDSNLWYVIGHWMYWKRHRDAEFVRTHLESLRRAMTWLEYQDSNDCGLLESHECYDWADLFPNRYNVLLPNVLWQFALRGMGDLLEACGENGDDSRAEAERVRRYVRLLFWVTGERDKVEEHIAGMIDDHGEWALVYRQMAALFWNRDYFMPYVPFRVPPEDRLDTLGNLVAILTGVADEEETGRILDYIHTRGVSNPFPCKACYPPVQQGNPDWRPYLLNREYCRPYSGHNAGVWPFIGGFYVCALVAAGKRDRAEEELVRLTEANAQNDWEFPELLHGETGRSIGAARQAWSAGMYLAAVHALREGKNVMVP